MSNKAMEVSHEHAIEGLEISLEKLGVDLLEEVDGLTTNQLRRALKSTVEYLYQRKITADESALSDREKKFIGSLGALVEMGFAYQQYIFRELEMSKEVETNNQGEVNE